MQCLALLDFHQITNVHFYIKGGNCQFTLQMLVRKSAPHF
jgi:hypothetical protein